MNTITSHHLLLTEVLWSADLKVLYKDGQAPLSLIHSWDKMERARTIEKERIPVYNDNLDQIVFSKSHLPLLIDAFVTHLY